MPVKRIKKTFKPVRIVIDKKGSLSKHGYVTRDVAEKRHECLAKAIRSMVREKKITKHQAAVKVSKRLAALQVLHKDKKTMSDTFRRDANWIRKKFYDKEKPTKTKTKRKSKLKKRVKK